MPERIREIKKALLLFLPFIATAVMLTVIQPPFGLYWLAWVSLVPFILACSPDVPVWRLIILTYLISLCYWLGNLYWIYPVTMSGWVAFCLYTAILWPMLALCLRYCRRKKWLLFLVVPVLFVGAERLQGLFLGGFFWRFLAHSQYRNITLIQIADIFGAAGVSFLVAMVNGLLAELLIAVKKRSVFTSGIFLKAALVCALLFTAVIYGRWRISESNRFIEDGPLVASLQSNIPQTVKDSPDCAEALFDELLQKSKAGTKAGADLIVWPETMVQGFLDTRVLNILSPSSRDKIFDEALSEHAKDNSFILVGAYGGKPAIKDDGAVYLTQRYNSAFLYGTDGRQGKKQYNKIHLVPFGEVVPFRKNFPLLHKLLMKFTPYDYDYNLDYGSEYTVFELTDNKKQSQQVYKFSVMICYEDTIPAIARKFAMGRKGAKNVDWLVNISNDGWFVRFENDNVFPSTELVQHSAVCVFRAVENRLAVLRSVNTGVSCLVDSLGCVRDGFLAGDLPREAMARKGMAGWFMDKMPIDKRTTFFSKYGQWLDFCCAVSFVLLIIMGSIEQKPKNNRS